MTNELLPTRLDYSDTKTLSIIKNTVAKTATVEEFHMFVEFCKGTGLNPFKKEIWFIKDKTGKVQMMTGVNGFYSIANDNPQFDGIEIIETGEQEIELLLSGNKVKKIKVPKSVEAKVYRKDRKIPFTAIAKWDEYSKPLITPYGNLSVWGQMPSVMLSKCAESMALRKAFPQELNGLYTAEEMPAEFASDKTEVLPKVEAAQVISPAPSIPKVSDEQLLKNWQETVTTLPAEKSPPIRQQEPGEPYLYKYKPPYAQKDEAKSYGCKWCPETKTWDHTEYIEEFAEYLSNPKPKSLEEQLEQNHQDQQMMDLVEPNYKQGAVQEDDIPF